MNIAKSYANCLRSGMQGRGRGIGGRWEKDDEVEIGRGIALDNEHLRTKLYQDSA